jgi:hypothetical protein
MTADAMQGWHDFFIAEAGAGGTFGAWVLLVKFNAEFIQAG